MPNVAIACQGGGSHTAFTAGVLQEVLPWLAAHDCRLVGLSGTSGGAVSATAAWYGLQSGGPEAAVATLDDLWGDVVTANPWARWVNEWTVGVLEARNNGAPLPTVSPYLSPAANLAEREFVRTLERHVDFEAFPELATPDAPELVIGTVNVNAGAFETFTNGDVTAETVLASAAIPTMFEAVEIHGHGHWDGLFSQNPPVHDLMTVSADRKPDELWVVQINPQTTDEVPTSLQEINDRRNELSGNISLNQELRFIEEVNDWIEAGHLPEDEFSKTTVRRVMLGQQFSHSSKFDRSEAFVEGMVADGQAAAADFLDEVEADLNGKTT
ncbi:patatin-like phospholipase family protein [Halobacteriales archaeon Cl-PHB]